MINPPLQQDRELLKYRTLFTQKKYFEAHLHMVHIIKQRSSSLHLHYVPIKNRDFYAKLVEPASPITNGATIKTIGQLSIILGSHKKKLSTYVQLFRRKKCAFLFEFIQKSNIGSQSLFHEVNAWIEGGCASKKERPIECYFGDWRSLLIARKNTHIQSEKKFWAAI